MRLNRYLASCGLGSRRSVEEIIEQRRVLINGEEVTSLGVQVKDGDVVTVDGRRFSLKSSTTIVLNKPRGVLTSREDETGQGRDTLYDLLPDHMKTLHYVGRLDKESEGLILLTNSGELTEKLTHPRFEVEKEYLVALDKVFRAEEHTPAMLEGFAIEGGFAKAKLVEVEAPRVVAVVLTQGIKRQIRLMFEALGYEVVRLERVRIGGYICPELRSGKWRALQESDIQKLLEGRLPVAPTGRGRIRSPKKKPSTQGSSPVSGTAATPETPGAQGTKFPRAAKKAPRSISPRSGPSSKPWGPPKAPGSPRGGTQGPRRSDAAKGTIRPARKSAARKTARPRANRGR